MNNGRRLTTVAGTFSLRACSWCRECLPGRVQLCHKILDLELRLVNLRLEDVGVQAKLGGHAFQRLDLAPQSRVVVGELFVLHFQSIDARGEIADDFHRLQDLLLHERGCFFLRQYAAHTHTHTHTHTHDDHAHARTHAHAHARGYTHAHPA